MLDSLLDQDIEQSEYEIIVVDDGSEEEPVVLKEYVRQYSQIQYHRIEHAGLSPARNYGLYVAKGRWLYFCDSDDFVQRQVLGGIIAEAEGHQLEMIWTRYTKVFSSTVIKEPRRNFSDITQPCPLSEYIKNNQRFPCCGVWSYLLRHSFVKDHDLSFRNINYVEERFFLLNLIKCVSRFALIDVDLYYYVQNEDSIVHSIKRHNCSAFAEAWYEYLNQLSVLIDNPTTPTAIISWLKYKRASGSVILLKNVFKYGTVNKTIDSISRLEKMGAYPILGESIGKRAEVLRKKMNKRHLWLLLCRIYHLLPGSVRMRR